MMRRRLFLYPPPDSRLKNRAPRTMGTVSQLVGGHVSNAAAVYYVLVRTIVCFLRKLLRLCQRVTRKRGQHNRVITKVESSYFSAW